MTTLRFLTAWTIVSVILSRMGVAAEADSKPLVGQDFATGIKVEQIAFSPDGERIAVGDEEGIVSLWDVRTGRQEKKWPAHVSPVWELAFSRDGRLLASAGKVERGTFSLDSEIKVWDTGSFTQKLRLSAYGYLHDIDFSADGTLLAAGFATNAGLPRDGNLMVWQLGDGKLLRSHTPDLPIYRQWVRSVSFSPDGRSLAYSAGKTSVLKLQDGSLRPVGDGTGSDFVLFLHEGTVLLTRGDALTLWKADRPQSLKQMEGLRTAGPVAVSPDEAWAALIDRTALPRDGRDDFDANLVLVNLKTMERRERPFNLGLIPQSGFAVSQSRLAVRRAADQGVTLFDLSDWQATLGIGKK